MTMSLEKDLIDYCSPTLAGLKAGSIFNCFCASDDELSLYIHNLNKEMIKKGIKIIVINRIGRRALIYVYRSSRLSEILKRSDTARFLNTYGYDVNEVDRAINHLKKRFADSDEFPHEIGIFLDYPLEDVVGFIDNTGKNYTYLGCWKSYCDPKKAERAFCKFRSCTNAYTKLWQNGRSLFQLTVAA